jgi:hypothetical protein
MKRVPLFCFALAVAFPVLAIDRDDCAGPLTHLGSLYQIRSIMMRRYSSSSDVQRFIDQRVEELRVPQPGGGYKWVRWMRPSGSGPVEKKVHAVNAVHGQGDPDLFETSALHVYAVRIVVPSKRSMFKGNNPVYVGDVRIKYGRRADVMHVNRWMQPDTSQTFELDGIYDDVLADAQVSVDPRDVKEAVFEIHFHQAVAQDDPANPAYSTIMALGRIRESPDPATVDSEIAALESSLFPGSDPLPLLTIMRDLRRADELMRSDKKDEQEKGDRLLRETLRRLR